MPPFIDGYDTDSVYVKLTYSKPDFDQHELIPGIGRFAHSLIVEYKPRHDTRFIEEATEWLDKNFVKREDYYTAIRMRNRIYFKEMSTLIAFMLVFHKPT